MSDWFAFNKEVLAVSAFFIIVFIITARFKLLRTSAWDKAVKLRTAMLLMIFSFLMGWAITSNIMFLKSPEYQIYNYRSASVFDNIVESVPLTQIDTSKKDESGHYEAFYTSDEPFLIEVDRFRGLIFCPARPAKLGRAGVIPLQQLALHSPSFKAHAILSTELSIIIGKNKNAQEGASRDRRDAHDDH